MVVNWKSTESQERLLACVVAAFLPNKVDYGKVATLFGSDVTQGAVEFQFRAVRKMAEQVQREAGGENNSAGPANAPESTKKKTTPKKSPSKKKATPGDGGVIDGKVKKTRKPAASKTKAAKLEKTINAQEPNEGYFNNTTESMDDDQDNYPTKHEILHDGAMDGNGDVSLDFQWGDEGTKNFD